MRLKRIILPALLLVLLVGGLAGCATAPYTGRQQLILVPEDQMTQMGRQYAAEVRKEGAVVTGTPFADMVAQVGARIAQVTETPDTQWNFSTIKGDDLNAFALPGGEVFVYTGMEKIAGTPEELAVVMSHEVAHVIVRHGSERMSQSMALGLAGSALLTAGGMQGYSPQTLRAFETAFGIGSQVGVLLPFSRQQETEADHVGLILMAKACYDPGKAIGFWEEMVKAGEGGQRPPTFLSTHPGQEGRIADIRSFLPEAQRIYRERCGRR